MSMLYIPSFNRIIVHLRDIFIAFKYYSCFNILTYVRTYFLCKYGPQGYIGIHHQIYIDKCSLNIRVLTNVNICFSPTLVMVGPKMLSSDCVCISICMYRVGNNALQK